MNTISVSLVFYLKNVKFTLKNKTKNEVKIGNHIYVIGLFEIYSFTLKKTNF